MTGGGDVLVAVASRADAEDGKVGNRRRDEFVDLMTSIDSPCYEPSCGVSPQESTAPSYRTRAAVIGKNEGVLRDGIGKEG